VFLSSWGCWEASLSQRGRVKVVGVESGKSDRCVRVHAPLIDSALLLSAAASFSLPCLREEAVEREDRR